MQLFVQTGKLGSVWATHDSLLGKRRDMEVKAGWYTTGFFDHSHRLNTALKWNELHPAVQASTMFSMPAVGHGVGGCSSTSCSTCREVDHTADYCAMKWWQQSDFTPGADGSHPVRKHATVASHSSCISWNKGQCLYPGSCAYRCLFGMP